MSKATATKIHEAGQLLETILDSLPDAFPDQPDPAEAATDAVAQYSSEALNAIAAKVSAADAAAAQAGLKVKVDAAMTLAAEIHRSLKGLLPQAAPAPEAAPAPAA